MKIFQGILKISNGKIRDLIPGENNLRIILTDEGVEYDYGNSYAIPGLVDSHGHIAALGKKLNGLSLNDCNSAEECAITATNYNALRGDWIVGSGWNQERWHDTSYPFIDILDRYFPDNPVYLMRVDGHTCWVNSKALEIAGIDRFTPDPPGGTIEKDKSGNPTGILIDNAFLVVKKFIPQHTLDQVESFITDAINELSANGLTEVHDMDIAPELIPIYQKLNNENKLKLRIQSFITAQNDEYIKHNIQVFNSKYYSIVGIKFYADGALGSHGAALNKPYRDKPSSLGLKLTDEKTLFEQAKIGLENSYQIATHAIGDAANRMVINIYKELHKKKIADKTNRLRVEHAQIIHPDDLSLFGEYGIIASVQPIHCFSDRDMAPKRLGTRESISYPWRSLIRNGALLLGGSDFPIESHNPFLGIKYFINREYLLNKEGQNTEEYISIDDAYKAYNLNPHKTISINPSRGEIREKMDADICVLNYNPYQMVTDLTPQKPIAVFCDGKITFQDN